MRDLKKNTTVIVSLHTSSAVSYSYTSFLSDTFPIKIGLKWKYDETVTILYRNLSSTAALWNFTC